MTRLQESILCLGLLASSFHSRYPKASFYDPCTDTVVSAELDVWIWSPNLVNFKTYGWCKTSEGDWALTKLEDHSYK